MTTVTERAFADNTLLGDARQYVRDMVRSTGKVNCPCCGKRVARYERKLHAGMIRDLAGFYRVAGRDWTSYTNVRQVGGDYAKLDDWGLLEPANGKKDDGNSNGVWRVTELGEAFLKGRVTALSHLGYFQDKTFPLPNKSKPVYVHDIVGGFRLDELFRESGEPDV